MSRTAGLGVPIRGAEAAGAVSWQGSVKDKDLTAPPGSPTEAYRYIVSSPATGAWSGEENSIAEWDGAVWIFSTPSGGWAAWVDDETEIYVFNGSSWEQESFGPHAVTHKGGGGDEIDAATSSLAGLMSAADKASSDARVTIIKTGDDIEAILEAASDGDSFWLEDGTHTAAGLITISNKKNITIRGGAGAIITKAADENIFRIEGCHDLTMAGFSINVVGTGGAGIILIVDASAGAYLRPTRHEYAGLHFEVATAEVFGCIAGSDDLIHSTIRDCTFTGLVGISIALSSVDLTGTIIKDNHCVTTYAGGAAIEISTTTGIGITIEGNHFEGPDYNSISIGDSEGTIIRGNVLRGSTNFAIDVAGSAARTIVVDNMIYDAAGGGIQCSGAFAIIHGNEIYSPAGDGIQLISSTNTLVTDNLVENGSAYGLTLDAASTSCTVGDNHFSGNSSGEENISVEFRRPDGRYINPLLATTDGTVTTIATIPIPDDTVVWIETDIEARRTDVADRAKFKRGALIYREAAGAATREGAVWTPLTIPAATPYDASIVVSGYNALIQVTGDVAHDVNWQSRHVLAERS